MKNPVKTTSQKKQDGKRRLKNKMIIVGHAYESAGPVAYLLLDDDTVVSYTRTRTGGPFTYEQAQRILQLATEPIYIGARIVKGDETKGVSKILMTINPDHESLISAAYMLYTDGHVETALTSDYPQWCFTEREVVDIMTDIGEVVDIIPDIVF